VADVQRADIFRVQKEGLGVGRCGELIPALAIQRFGEEEMEAGTAGLLDHQTAQIALG